MVFLNEIKNEYEREREDYADDLEVLFSKLLLVRGSRLRAKRNSKGSNQEIKM